MGCRVRTWRHECSQAEEDDFVVADGLCWHRDGGGDGDGDGGDDDDGNGDAT